MGFNSVFKGLITNPFAGLEGAVYISITERERERERERVSESERVRVSE